MHQPTQFKTALLLPFLFPLLTSVAPLAAQLSTAGSHLVLPEDVGEAAEGADRFGTTLASGDWNDDGFLDLAIGVPTEDLDTIVDAGVVHVVFGASAGLGQGPLAPILLHQDIAGVTNHAETGDHFGAALAAGDFDGDGTDDLAVGIPGEDVSGFVDTGAVAIFAGNSSGSLTSDNRFLHQGDFPGIVSHGISDHFGQALGTFDFAGNGTLDLVIGIPGEDVSGNTDQGTMVYVIDPLGSPLLFAWSPSSADPGDRLGSMVAVGDVDANGSDEILVGGPTADAPGRPDAGVFHTVFSALPPIWGLQADAFLGTALAAGDFSGLGYDQVLIGAPGVASGAGEASVLDWVEVSTTRFDQAAVTSGETAEAGDAFGEVLAVGDFDGDGFVDAVFGTPAEDTTSLDAGVVQVAHGGASGLGLGTGQLWKLNDLGVLPFPNDEFGGALATGDWNGDGADDLAVGVPGAFWGGANEAGLVGILYGTSSVVFADGFESGDTDAWE